MASLVVVVVEPWCQGCAALVVADEHLTVCPFGLQGPVEAFHFAVLPGTVRFDRDVFGSELFEHVPEVVAAGVAPVVVGHHFFDPIDAVYREVASGSEEKAGAGNAGLVGVDLRVGQAGVVIDC